MKEINKIKQSSSSAFGIFSPGKTKSNGRSLRLRKKRTTINDPLGSSKPSKERMMLGAGSTDNGGGGGGAASTTNGSIKCYFQCADNALGNFSRCFPGHTLFREMRTEIEQWYLHFILHLFLIFFSHSFSYRFRAHVSLSSLFSPRLD